MFGREDELIRYLLALGSGTAALTALLTWAAARRYGRPRALVIPVLALVAVAGLVWRTHGTGGQAGMGITAATVVLAGPAVAGGLLGLALSVFPRR